MLDLIRGATLVAMVLVLGGCSGATESTLADDQGSVKSSEKGAAVQSNTVSVNKQSFSILIRNPCTGGFVRVNGTRHVTDHTKERGDGSNGYRYSLNQVGHGTDAAGTKYTYKANIIETEVIGDPDDCPYTFIEVRRIHLNAPGKGNNMVATVRFEVTTNCDGSFEVKHNVDEVICQ